MGVATDLRKRGLPKTADNVYRAGLRQYSIEIYNTAGPKVLEATAAELRKYGDVQSAIALEQKAGALRQKGMV